MKLIYIAITALFVFFTFAVMLPMRRLHAEDVIQMNDQQDISMSGTITKLEDKDFILSTGDTSTTVSIGDMNMSADIKNLLKPGMKVTVNGSMTSGMFNEPVIRAKTISAYQDTLAPGAPVPPTAGGATPVNPIP